MEADGITSVNRRLEEIYLAPGSMTLADFAVVLEDYSLIAAARHETGFFRQRRLMVRSLSSFRFACSEVSL
jgi:hypothetical protein